MLGDGFSIVLGILLVSLSGSLGDCPYAKFSPEHTACLPPNPTCDIIKKGVTDQDKQHILELHNQYRSQISTGQESRGGGMPQAANMLELVWDDELAMLAQLHAQQCVVEHECNECRQVDRFPVGQNLFYSGDTQLPTTFDWDFIMKVFYDEVSYFNTQAMNPYTYEEAYGHFTQLVWGSSQYVGCGSIVANASGFYNTIYVCDFGIAGNDIGGEMYRVGPYCSACPANASSCTVSGQGSYEGLCRASNTMSSPHKTTLAVVSSKAPAPSSTKAPTQPKHETPAQIIYGTPAQIIYDTPPQIIYETPEELNYEAPDQMYYEAPFQYSEAPVQYYEAPVQYYEAPVQYYEKPDQKYYEAPVEYYDRPDQMYYEGRGKMTYGAPTQLNYGLPGNMMYEVQYR